MAAGRICGIGVGPGDPELITVKGLNRLRAADLVAYPAPETGRSTARTIVGAYLRPGQAEYAIRIPMRPDISPLAAIYRAAAEHLAERAAGGARIAVLCEGDPLFYGTFMYLHEYLSPLVPVEIIPGVSSLVAAAARLGTPLARRTDVLSVVPATLPRADLRRRLAGGQPVAIIKLGRHFDKVREVLTEVGRLAAARYIAHATMQEEEICPLAAVDGAHAPYFSIILVAPT